MADIKQKIEALKTRISGIDERMKQLLLQKKDLERQIREIEEQEILSVVRSNGADIETLNSDLALAKLLRENNLTREDILELVAPQTETHSEAKPYNSNSTSNGGTNL